MGMHRCAREVDDGSQGSVRPSFNLKLWWDERSRVHSGFGERKGFSEKPREVEERKHLSETATAVRS
jgi:hypothetical protein